jgi:hypothetical protein
MSLSPSSVSGKPCVPGAGSLAGVVASAVTVGGASTALSVSDGVGTGVAPGAVSAGAGVAAVSAGAGAGAAGAGLLSAGVGVVAEADGAGAADVEGCETPLSAVAGVPPEDPLPEEVDAPPAGTASSALAARSRGSALGGSAIGAMVAYRLRLEDSSAVCVAASSATTGLRSACGLGESVAASSVVPHAASASATLNTTELEINLPLMGPLRTNQKIPLAASSIRVAPPGSPLTRECRGSVAQPPDAQVAV